MKVVVAVDGVNDAPFRLSDKLGFKEGWLVHVINGVSGEPLHDNVERVESYLQQKKAMEEVAPRYQREGWTFEVVASPDTVGKALCAFAEKVGADLLVIGHSEGWSLDHLLMGSNAAYCTKHAKCSVLVAKP